MTINISGISGMQTSRPLKAAHNKQPRHEKNVSGNRATPIAPREITGEVSKKVEPHNGKSHSFDISVTELSLKKSEADGADGCKGCNSCVTGITALRNGYTQQWSRVLEMHHD